MNFSVLVYGRSAREAQAKAQALALRVLADRLEHGEAVPFERRAQLSAGVG